MYSHTQVMDRADTVSDRQHKDFVVCHPLYRAVLAALFFFAPFLSTFPTDLQPEWLEWKTNCGRPGVYQKGVFCGVRV